MVQTATEDQIAIVVGQIVVTGTVTIATATMVVILLLLGIVLTVLMEVMVEEV